MSRNSHDGTCSVGSQYIVRDPDWDLFIVNRIYGIGSGKDTGLILVQFRTFQIALGRYSLLICLNCFFLFRRCDLIY